MIASETNKEQELATSLQKHEAEENRPAMAVDCYRLGTCHQEQGRLKGAEAMFRRALVLCEALKDRQGVAAAYSKLGLLHEMYGDIGQARFYLEQSREIHETTGDVCGLASDYSYLGFLRFREGEFDAAEGLYRRALEFSQQVNEWGQQAEDLANLANLDFARGQIDSAEDGHHRALKLYQETGDEKGIGSEYRSLGSIWFKRGDVDQAEAFLQLGLELHEKVGWITGIGLNCSDMAIALERRQQFGKAEEYRLRAIDQFKTAGHRTHFATEQCRLGWLRLNLEDAEGASECFEDAAVAQEETGDMHGLAHTCKKLGDIYLKPSVLDLSRAQEMYDRALAAFRATGEEAGEGNAYAGLGNVAARKGEVPEAVAMWTAASERFKKLGVIEKVEEIDQALKKVWRGTGNVA